MQTFVVRIWSPADGTPVESHGPTLRGTVEDVSSGRSVPFRNETELAGLIRTFLKGRSGDAARRS